MIDKGFWTVIGLFILQGVMLAVLDQQFVAGNTFARARFQDEVLPRQQEIPELVRKFVHVSVENETEFLELRAGSYVRRSVGSVFAVALIAFVFLSVRQRRLMQRLRELEAHRADAEE